MISILPTNATPLERVLDLASAAEPRVIDGVEAIATAKLVDIPDALIPWLIWEYGLGELLPYLPDPRVAIREGVLWQRVRGTPRSLQIAYSWRGLNDVIVEEEETGRAFAEFQIGTRRIPPAGAVEDLIELSRLAAPVRSLLSRLYHGYDVRRFILSRSDWGDLLSNYSGVLYDPDRPFERGNPYLSFGRGAAAALDVAEGQAAAAGLTRAWGGQAIYGDRAILDYWRFDEEWSVTNHPVIHSHLFIFWAENRRGTAADPAARVMPPLTFPRSEIVLSDDGYRLGDTHARFAVRLPQQEGDAYRLSDDDLTLGEHIFRSFFVPIDEVFDRDTGVHLLVPSTLARGAARAALRGFGWFEPASWPTLSGSFIDMIFAEIGDDPLSPLGPAFVPRIGDVAIEAGRFYETVEVGGPYRLSDDDPLGEHVWSIDIVEIAQATVPGPTPAATIPLSEVTDPASPLRSRFAPELGRPPINHPALRAALRARGIEADFGIPIILPPEPRPPGDPSPTPEPELVEIGGVYVLSDDAPLGEHVWGYQTVLPPPKEDPGDQPSEEPGAGEPAPAPIERIVTRIEPPRVTARSMISLSDDGYALGDLHARFPTAHDEIEGGIYRLSDDDPLGEHVWRTVADPVDEVAERSAAAAVDTADAMLAATTARAASRAAYATTLDVVWPILSQDRLGVPASIPAIARALVAAAIYPRDRFWTDLPWLNRAWGDTEHIIGVAHGSAGH